MIQERSRPLATIVITLLLAMATVGAPASVLAADDAAEASAAASPAPEASPTAETADDASSLRLRVDLLAGGLTAPVYLTDDGVGGAKAQCLYVVERGGTVRRISRTGAIQGTFLDIGNLLGDDLGPEQGLHSIAFHPDFAKNRRLFAHYNGKDGAAVIAEFKGRPCKSANKKPVKTLLTENQEYINNNAGWIGFGPDGYLYIPLGDGGGPFPGDPNGIARDKGARLAKILRIDVDGKGRLYDSPASNPFVRKKKGRIVGRGGYSPSAFALGVQDPRRASFDRKTGDLWFGDGGVNIEEVNRIPAGATKRGSALDFGWSDLEGDTTCHPNVPDCDPSAYDAPVHFYDQVPPQGGITGGYVYRGETYPELDGMYLFSDTDSGFVWGLDADAVVEGLPAPAYQLLDLPQGVASFGEDDDGELYLVSLDGSVYRLGVEGA
jgi:glucose/arabinose dehydrogenase